MYIYCRYHSIALLVTLPAICQHAMFIGHCHLLYFLFVILYIAVLIPPQSVLSQRFRSEDAFLNQRHANAELEEHGSLTSMFVSSNERNDEEECVHQYIASSLEMGPSNARSKRESESMMMSSAYWY